MDQYNQGPKIQRARPPAWGEVVHFLDRVSIYFGYKQQLLDEIHYRSARFRPEEAFSSSMDSTSNAPMPPTAGLLCRPSRTLCTRVSCCTNEHPKFQRDCITATEYMFRNDVLRVNSPIG